MRKPGSACPTAQPRHRRRYGKEIWHYETGDMVPGSPTVEDDVDYVGSFDHTVYAPEVNL